MVKKILIAAPVFQEEKIFIEYLNSLNHLIIPEGYEVKRFFYLHNSPQLAKFLKKDEYEIITDEAELLRNNNDKNKNKIWTEKNYYALYKMRTELLRKASRENYDYLFTIDSDILLHPKTLITLLKDNKKVVGNMIWTKTESERIGAICGKDEEWGAYEDLSIFNIPNVYEVGWTCACLLISSKIFNNTNISYFPIPGIDNTGCEDYAFCLRIKCNLPEVKIWIDTKLPARHLYNKKDYDRWMKEKEEYEQSCNW